MSRLVIFGGSGFLGHHLTKYYIGHGWETVVVARSKTELVTGARFVPWDGQTLGDWTGELEGATAVINLAGRSVNCRHTEANKRQIYESRIQTTSLIGQAMTRTDVAPRIWLNASGASIYRDAFAHPMDEANGELGTGFLVDVARQWEASFFEPSLPSTRRIAMRLALTFGPAHGKEQGVWGPYAALVRLGFGGPMGDGKQFVSWIHVRDFVRATHWLIEHHELEGPINIAAPNPLPNVQFLSALRRALKVPFSLPLSRWQLALGALMLGTEADLQLRSRRVVPKKLLESGFRFEFSKWEEAARDIAVTNARVRYRA